MTGWPHFLQFSTAKGAKSPEMNVLDWHRPQVTILNGLLAPVAPSLTACKFNMENPGNKLDRKRAGCGGPLTKLLDRPTQIWDHYSGGAKACVH
jgi:hypothetical protein